MSTTRGGPCRSQRGGHGLNTIQRRGAYANPFVAARVTQVAATEMVLEFADGLSGHYRQHAPGRIGSLLSSRSADAQFSPTHAALLIGTVLVSVVSVDRWTECIVASEPSWTT